MLSNRERSLGHEVVHTSHDPCLHKCLHILVYNLNRRVCHGFHVAHHVNIGYAPIAEVPQTRISSWQMVSESLLKVPNQATALWLLK